MKKDILKKLETICVYRNVINSKIIAKLIILLNNIENNHDIINSYNDFVVEVYELDCSIKEAIIDEILLCNNAMTNMISKHKVNEHIREAIKNELEVLHNIMNITSEDLKDLMSEKIDASTLMGFDNTFISDNETNDYERLKSKISAFKLNNYGLVDDIIHFHEKHGVGRSVKYSAFVWQRYDDEDNGKLVEIMHPDPIRLDDLIGYEHQKKELLLNTKNFVNGKPANNVLLYGSRGTGKSSSVKAILNEFKDQGLRLIEVDKTQLADFTRIITLLRDKKQKFIIFVDDLVFDEKESGYSALKTILEGRIEKASNNILIYATTNRRHLVVEKFSDKDEINEKDTIEEKLSLSDRFGLTISYLSCSQKEYFDIVLGLAQQANMDIDKNYLQQEARKWALWHNGMSPRSAKQFITHILGEK